MRRPALIAALAAGLLALAGCGSGKTVAPLPNTVEGTLPAQTQTTPTVAKGNAAAGKPVFTAQGCGACHAFKPAGSSGVVGPNLDNLAADAKKANQGSLQDYTLKSIVDPSAYVVPGFPDGTMPSTYGTTIKPQQLADLVAFLTQNQS